MNLRIIKLYSNCIICDCKPASYTFTCKKCTKLLPFDFYDDKAFKKCLPDYISKHQQDQYMARYIIKYFIKMKGKNETSNDM